MRHVSAEAFSTLVGSIYDCALDPARWSPTLDAVAAAIRCQTACMVLYLIPRTSLLGMVLLTGYFGGAIASYVRIGEPFPFPLITCLFFWAGLYLRDERIRALLPFRR